jgi:Serine/Threonine/Tyrosine Kinase found in polyvalent proteins
MSPNGSSHTAAGIPLKALVEELRRRCEAISRFQGGTTYYQEELGIFRTYASAAGLFAPEPPVELSRAPDEEGNEHQVWYLPDSEWVFKATWPNFFGLLVVHRPHEEQKASPIAYLERWHLHNEAFGDQVEFLGALESDAGLRLLIRQPGIAGTPATDEQIRNFFTDSGWLPFVIEGNTAFFDPERKHHPHGRRPPRPHRSPRPSTLRLSARYRHPTFFPLITLHLCIYFIKIRTTDFTDFHR